MLVFGDVNVPAEKKIKSYQAVGLIYGAIKQNLQSPAGDRQVQAETAMEWQV